MKVTSVYTSAGCRRASTCSDVVSASGLVAFAAGPRLALWDSSSGKGVSHSFGGHTANLTKVRFIEDDAVVTGDDAGQLRLWRCIERQWTSIDFAQNHGGSVSSLAGLRLPKGDLVVSGSSDGALRVWLASAGRISPVQKINLDGRMPLACALAFFPGSNDILLALASTDVKLRIFIADLDALDFQLIATITGHTDWLRALAFHADDRDEKSLLLASGAQDHTVRLWRIVQGGPPKSDILDIQVRPYALRVKDHAYTLRADATLIAHESWVNDLTWRHDIDGSLQLLTASSDRSMMLWRHDLADSLWLVHAHFGELKPSEHSLGFFGAMSSRTAEGIERVIAHGWSGAFHVWRRAEQGDWAPEVAPTGHLDEARSIAWDPQGEFLISVGADRTARLHAQVSNVWREVGRPQVHGHELFAVTFIGQDRLRIASAADEPVVRTYEAPQRTIDRLVDLGAASDFQDGVRLDSLYGWRNSIQLAQTSTRPRAAILPTLGLTTRGVDEEEGEDRSLWAYAPLDEELQSLTIWPETDKHYGHGYELRSLASSPDGIWLASACKSASNAHAVLRTRHMSTNREVALPAGTAHSLTVSRITFSNNGSRLLTCSRDRSWRLYAVPDRDLQNDGEPNFEFKLLAFGDKAHTRVLFDCCFLADRADAFATAARDKTVKLWSVKDNAATCETTLKLDAPATSLASTVLNEHMLLIVGLETGSLLLYGFASSSALSACALIQVIDNGLAHTGAVNQLAFSPRPPSDTVRLASCADDGHVRLLELAA